MMDEIYRQVHKIDVGKMPRKEADKMLDEMKVKWLNESEATCCWCRKVIKDGEEDKHVHSIRLRK